MRFQQALKSQKEKTLELQMRDVQRRIREASSAGHLEYLKRCLAFLQG